MKKHQSLSILLVSLVLISFNLQAQRFEDVIYLSNGGVMHGILLSEKDAEIIRIINHEGDTWVFKRSEVDSIRTEKPSEYKAKLFNQPGIEVCFNMEALLRSGSNAVGKSFIPGINAGMGYRFNQNISAGGTFGLEFYDWMEVPLSASIRLRTNGRTLSQLLFIDAGYTLPAEKRANDWEYSYKSLGGIHTSIGAGIEKIISSNASFLITFSYHYQELNYHLDPLNQWVQARDRTETYSRLRISLGYIFK